MKILCVADHIDPLVYSVNAKERFDSVEMVISAGDLPMEYLGFLSSVLNKPVLFVFGNHNLQELYRFRRGGAPRNLTRLTPSLSPNLRNYFGSTYIGGRVVRRNGLILAGLGGSKRYNNGLNQFTELQMLAKMLRMLPRLIWNRVVHGRYLDILLTHASPFEIGDRPDPCHRGFKVFRWFIRRFRPRFMLHGHIHLYDINAQRIHHYHDTTIINVYDHYVLDTEESYE
ncbi:metallophosphoesterase family protein [Spirochaeta africana]|uniref:Putative phosphoesterase, ICC n=1 Tax=Spirochaeta africana (strain ATCC 700263 / DSM 8902 / Z-7692) TaxID=889378 RepID=H9UJ18_SPIAZ|nr:metallophosphoesterase [Spirochaeta africana]AFG37511.1 putative phosphoesterase, ICC [Spirochaeta africana DSM 8902]